MAGDGHLLDRLGRWHMCAAAPAAALILGLVLAPALPARADMGAIVPSAHVSLSEPGQKAIIAHDGFEEVLILGTDMAASTAVEALRFIPLPSEPQVRLADREVFADLERLARAHGMRYLVKSRGGALAVPEGPGPPVELRFHRRLGAHDVTVVRVRRPEEVADWVREYFGARGIEARDLSRRESAVIGDYVRRGFDHFVFDRVDLDAEPASVSPLVYRFRTRHLYYPLKTSNLFGGRGRIELHVFSDRGESYPALERPTRKGHGRPFLAWTATSTVAEVSAEEMASVDPAIAELLGANGELRAFMREGLLKFEDDIWIGAPLSRRLAPPIPSPAP